MLEVLTGTGLASAAGLNAYIPLLTVGVLARYTDLIELPDGWRWLSNPWLMATVAVLLVIEFVADKVPAVDHINDLIQTAIRPTSGGLTFGAATTSETVRVDNPSDFFGDHLWVPIVSGVVLAFGIHVGKAALRAFVNAATLGFGAPIVSTLEDGTSATLSLLAILVPLLVIVVLVLMVVGVWWLWQYARRRKEALIRAGTVPSDGRAPAR